MKLVFYFNKIKKTGVFINSEKSKIRKFSTENKSLALLKNEYRGYNWYLRQKRIQKKLFLSSPTRKSPFLDFSLIKGKEILFSRLLSENYSYMEKVTDFYNEFWPKNKVTPSHGDLTFANLIFYKNKIEIIDWENFTSKKQWGYDICYFLISSLTLPFIIRNKTSISNKGTASYTESICKKSFFW